MRKIFESRSELQEEMKAIEMQELDFNFTRKQELAHLLLDVMTTTHFTEAKLIGQIEGEYTDEGMHPGVYFDAKTKSENYTGVDIGGDHYYDEEEEEGDGYDATQKYEERINYYRKSNFSKLIDLADAFELFVVKHKHLESELVSQMMGVGFTSEYKSIVKAVMNEGEYKEWLILSEQKSLANEVGHENMKKTQPRQKKI